MPHMMSVTWTFAALDAELLAGLGAQVEDQRCVRFRALHHVVDRSVLAGVGVPVTLRLAVVSAIRKLTRAAGGPVVEGGNAMRIELAGVGRERHGRDFGLAAGDLLVRAHRLAVNQFLR